MSDIQRITVRNAATELQIADNQTTGTIDIGGAQTTGNIFVGNSSARTTGAVQIGTLSGTGQTLIRGNTINCNSGSSTTIQGATMNLVTTSGSANLQANGSANVTSVTSTANVTGATGSTIKATTGVMKVESTAGQIDIDASTTLNLNSGTTSAIGIGQTQTSGAINLGTGATRTAAINIGAVGGTHSTNITAGTLTTSTSGTQTLSSIGDASFGSFLANTYVGLASTNRPVIIGVDNTTSAIGIGQNQTTGVINLGTNATRSGNINIGESGSTHTTRIRSAVIDSSSSGTTTFHSTGNMILYCSGGGTVYLGSDTLDQTVRIAQGNTTSNLIVATGQTSGEIFIGTNVARTGTIRIGGAGSTHLNLLRAQDNTLLATGATSVTGAGNLTLGSTAGNVISTASGTTSITGAGNVTLNSTGGTTLVQSVDMGSSNGTWTPVVQDDSGNAYGGQTVTGTWEKWGRIVSLYGSVAWTGKGTAVAGNSFQINGLPFNRYLASQGHYSSDYTSNTWLTGTGSNRITLFLTSGATTVINALETNVQLLVSETTTAGSFRFSFIYMAT